MTLHLTPEENVPFEAKNADLGFEEGLAAAANTASLLAAAGLDVLPDDEDEEIAANLALSYAADPLETSKTVSTKKIATLTPAALLLTQQILKDYGHKVVDDAVQIRHLVTNKLVQETENPDPRVRLKALELLGKFSDVGLFVERSEVTVTHQTTDDIRARLREKLQKIVDVTPVDGDGASRAVPETPQGAVDDAEVVEAT